MAKVESLLDNKEFIQFVIAAKQHMYASGAKPVLLANGSTLYTFADERWPQWRYANERDGYNPFLGREIYWERTSPYDPFTRVAHMAYDGYARGDGALVTQMFTYLGEVLRDADEKTLFRGPTSMVSGDEFTYTCTWHRIDLFRVQGEEYMKRRILSSQWPHYHLNFLFCCLR